jgi:hypothetical protein
MVSPIPRTDLVWYCEAADGDAERFLPAIKKACPRRTVVRFRSYADLRAALDEALLTRRVPWLVFTDSLAVTAPPQEHPVAQVLRDKSPLSLVYLFSGSAFRRTDADKMFARWKGERKAYKDWKRSAFVPAERPADDDRPREWVDVLLHHRLIAAARRKSEEAEMLADLRTLAKRWDRPAITRFREYALNKCSDPRDPFYRAGGERLSIFDLHREMVLGTGLGKEQETNWDEILNPAPKSAPKVR